LSRDYQDGLLPLAQLIGAYQTSWARFVDIVNYRNAYDSYFGSSDRVNDKLFFTITDPNRLAQFRATPTLLLTVDLPDLPPTRFEAKAIYVLLSLTGATANVPAISCLVEHGGQFTTRKRDGAVAGQILKPRTTVVQTAKSGITFTRRAHRRRPGRTQLLGPRRGDDVDGCHRAGRDGAPPDRPGGLVGH
jgi:hypothetical protein